MKLTVETTTPYLGIASDDPNGFLVKMVPPVRSKDHHDALWAGMLEGSINTVGTDNTSRARLTKKPESRISLARGRACRRSARICRRCCITAGCAAIPLEVLVDRATRGQPRSMASIRRRARSPSARMPILRLSISILNASCAPRDLQGMSDFSPFEGKTLRGWPVATIKAGQIVARDGKIVGKPTGRYLPREASGQRAGCRVVAAGCVMMRAAGLEFEQCLGVAAEDFDLVLVRQGRLRQPVRAEIVADERPVDREQDAIDAHLGRRRSARCPRKLPLVVR